MEGLALTSQSGCGLQVPAGPCQVFSVWSLQWSAWGGPWERQGGALEPQDSSSLAMEVKLF